MRVRGLGYYEEQGNSCISIRSSPRSLLTRSSEAKQGLIVGMAGQVVSQSGNKGPSCPCLQERLAPIHRSDRPAVDARGRQTQGKKGRWPAGKNLGWQWWDREDGIQHQVCSIMVRTITWFGKCHEMKDSDYDNV